MKLKALLPCLLYVLLLVTKLKAQTYDFSNLTDTETKPKEEKEQKKDYVTADEVFSLFKGEQKVAIVSKREERIQDAPATVYVITDKEIEERGYMFLHDLLRDVPGIDFINDLGVYGMLAMMRGMDTPENNKTLIFVDGILTNNPSQGVSYMSYQFSLHNVKRVEILWGPASALYGANAFAGIINIVTKGGKDLKGAGGKLSLGTVVPKITRQPSPAGIYLDFLAGGSLTGEEDGPSIVVSGNYLYSASGLDYARRHLPMSWAPSPKTDYYIPENAMPRLGDYQAMLKLEYEGFTFGIRAWRILSRQGGFATHNYMNTDLAYWGHQAQEIYLKFQKSLNQIISHQSVLAGRLSQLPQTPDPNIAVNDADRSAYGDNQGGDLLFYKRNDYAISYDHQWAFDWTNSINTTLGVFYEYAKVSNWNTNDTSLLKWDGTAFVQRYPEEKKATYDGSGKIISYGIGPIEKEEVYYFQQNLAAYLQQSQTLLEKLKIIGGARADYLLTTGKENPEVMGTTSNCTAPCTLQNTLFATDADAAAQGAFLKRSNVYYKVSPVKINVFSLNPRAGIVFNPTPKHTLKALHGWAFRNPTVRERFSLSGSRIPAGASLKPEKIKTTELGYSVRPFSWLQIEADAFYSQAEDLIQLTASSLGRPGKPVAMNQFQNVAKAELTGGELKLDAIILRSGNINAITFVNYSYQKNRYVNVPEGKANFISHDIGVMGDYKSSNYMPRISTHKANMGFTIYYGKEWVFSPVYHYVGERPNVITSPVEVVPAYHLLNFSFTYRPLKSRSQYQVSIFNALNKEINDPGTRDAAGDYFSPLRPVEKLTVWARIVYSL